MKKLFTICLLLCQLAAVAQTYKITLLRDPDNACRISSSPALEAEAGKTVKVLVNKFTGYVFDGFISADTIMGPVNDREYNPDYPGNYSVQFTMPAHDVTITAKLHYSPDLPLEPGEGMWNEATGALSITMVTPGTITAVIKDALTDRNGNLDANYSKVKSLTITGKANDDDMKVITNSRTFRDNITLFDISRTNGITELPSVLNGIFENKTALKTVLLPASIEKIGYNAFYGCTALESFTCFATTPPVLSYQVRDKQQNVFNTDGFTVFVPAESLPLYAEANGWKDLNLMPITQGVHKLTVNMPANADMKQLKDMYLELVNAKTGQTRRYVLTNRTQYTFTNLIEGTQYNIYIRNARENILGTIEAVDIEKQDVQVSFADLKPLRDVTLQLTAPDGSPVGTDAFTTTWTDAVGNYLAKGATLTAQVEGTKAIAHVKLDQKLGTQYQQPADTMIVVGKMDIVGLSLMPLTQAELSGTVTAATTGLPIRSANISVTQQLNGLYPVTLTTTTDKDGQWTLTAYVAPTTVTMQASGYVPQSITVESLPTEGRLEGALADITGTTVHLDLSYIPAVAIGQTLVSDDNYTNFDDAIFTIYDETNGKELTGFSVQSSPIVLEEALPQGTKLRVTINSRSNSFASIEGVCTVDAQNTANLSLPLLQLGQLRATFSQTDNLAVAGMLYDADGQLYGRYYYDEAKLSITDIPDGQYTLVTMGESRLFNGVNTLAALTEMRLEEGRDYVSNAVTIQAGRIDSLHNQRIPMMDETVFYYTGENTRFSVNKSQVTVGNYVTLRAQVDFKPGITPDDVQLLFDLPDGCSLVEGSVMAGNQLSTYEVDGNRVIVPLNNVSDQVRFCVIPTTEGYYEPTASIVFASTQGGTERSFQPIGSVAITADALSIDVPEQVADETVYISGIALGGAQVQVYDGDVLIGQMEAGPDGNWTAKCKLQQPYNLSQHNVYAVVTTDGINAQTETKTVTVSHGTLTPVVVMSYYDNGSSNKVKWDFRNSTVTPRSYKFNMVAHMGGNGLDATFKIDFMDGDKVVNDTLSIKDVVLYALLDGDSYVQLPLKYNKRSKSWYTNYKFTYPDLPVNVALEYYQDNEVVIDRQQMDDMQAEVEQGIAEKQQLVKDIYALPDKEIVLDEQPIFDELERLLAISGPDATTSERIDALLGLLTDGEEPTTADVETVLANIKANTDAFKAGRNKRIENILSLFSAIAIIDTTSVQKPEGDLAFDLPLEGGKARHFEAKKVGSINADALIASGYHKMPIDDGNALYYLTTNDKQTVVDTKTAIQYTVSTVAAAAARASAPLDFRIDSIFDQQVKREFIELINMLNQKDLTGGDTEATLNIIFNDYYENLSALNSYLGQLYKSGLSNMKDISARMYKQMTDMYDLLKYNAKEDTKQARQALSKAKEERTQCKKQRDEIKGHIETAQHYLDWATELTDTAHWQREIQDWQVPLQAAEAKLQQANKAVTEAENVLQEARRVEKWADEETKKATQTKKAIDDILNNLPVQAYKNLLPQSVLKKRSELEGTPIGVLLQILDLKDHSETVQSEIINWKKTYRSIKDKYPCEANQEGWSNLNQATIQQAYSYLSEGIEDCLWNAQLLADADFVPHGNRMLYWFLENQVDMTMVLSFSLTFSQADRKSLDAEIAALKCTEDEVDPAPLQGSAWTHKFWEWLFPSRSSSSSGKKGKTHVGPNKSQNAKAILDPSGYVYEAVESNRLEGVKATCFYKEMKEDMYGDLYENVVLWDAENYAQENPLFTDAEGKYRWDVPQGLWQVKYEKEGYETAYSEWLPVPPPQLEVNMGMKQLRQPAVSHVKACTDGIDITFDKYMDPQTLTAENILLIKGGQTVDGKIELLNAEGGYASKLRFNANLTTNDKVQLTVRRAVESYAGLQMEQDFTQQFDVEQRITAIVADSIVNLSEGSEYVLTVSLLPAEVAKGKKLQVSGTGDGVVSHKEGELTLDANGQATVVLTANSLGSSAVRFCLTDDPDLAATTLVTVRDAALMYVYAPRSSRMSGTEIYRGAEIRLTCQTAGATILYTLDGSCPCDAQNANVLTYTGPITATGDELTIRAMAVANGMAESDVVEFRYKVIDNPVGIKPIDNSQSTIDHSVKAYYRLDGRRTPTPQKGLNIVRQKDGTVQKVLVK